MSLSPAFTPHLEIISPTSKLSTRIHKSTRISILDFDLRDDRGAMGLPKGVVGL